MILSFSLTNKLAAKNNQPDPLIAGIKTCTRRMWAEVQAERWCNAYCNGARTHQAWSNSSYVKSAYQMGFIHLTCEPYQEPLIMIPNEDLYHEGNFWHSKEEFFSLFECDLYTLIWVVRFKFTLDSESVHQG